MRKKPTPMFPCFYCNRETEDDADALHFGLGMFAHRACHLSSRRIPDADIASMKRNKGIRAMRQVLKLDE